LNFKHVRMGEEPIGYFDSSVLRVRAKGHYYV